MQRFLFLFCFLWGNFVYAEFASFKWEVDDGDEEISQFFDTGNYDPIFLNKLPDHTANVSTLANIKDECRFVSLGSNCFLALLFKSQGIRSVAYPFDWLLTTSHEGVIEMLTDNFKYLFENQYYAPFDSNEWLCLDKNRREMFVKNVKYGIYFLHDWPFKDKKRNNKKYQEQLRFIQEKYSRRIERFKALNNYRGKVFFIRTSTMYEKDHIFTYTHMTEAQIERLKNALKQLFPKLDFTLVIVSYFQPEVSTIAGEGVICYHFTSKDEGEIAFANIIHSLFENYQLENMGN